KSEGFGVLTAINIKDTLKNKLALKLDHYSTLGACSPKHAYQAIESEPHIGDFLACNVIVKQLKNNQIEVAAVNPIASMGAVENKNLGKVAKEVEDHLKKAIDALK